MANDGITKRASGEWEMDIAAFIPDPQGFIKVQGEDYPIYSFLDIPVKDSMRVVKLSEEIENTTSYDEKMKLSIDHLLALNSGPEDGRGNRKLLTYEMLAGLAARQIIGLVVMANSIAAVPQKAEASVEQTASV